MQQYTVLLPTGAVVNSKIEQIIHGITDLFGGVTVVKNTYGLWVNPVGKIERDNHIMLIINTDKHQWIKTLKRKLEIELNQDWIYITKTKCGIVV